MKYYYDIRELYSASGDGFDIFAYYFGDDPKLKDPRHKFKLRDERTASAQLHYWKGMWRITDYGNQGEINGMSAIDYVIYRENLQFADAVRFIGEVILKRTVPSRNFQPAKHEAIYSSRDFNPETDRLGEYRFFFKKEPAPEDLRAIGRYVTKELLARFGCRTVDYYEYPKYSEKLKKNTVHIYKSHADYPIFIFEYGEFRKKYCPLDKDKGLRFMYIGKKPQNFIFGMKQLLNTEPEFNSEDDDEYGDAEPEDEQPEDGNEFDGPKPKRIVKNLFRCSGESDALNLASIGCHVYWLNSETAEMDARQFRDIDQYTEKHYQVMDLDATGVSEAQINALKHIDMYNVVLPQWITRHNDWRGNPCKDLKDFINLSGRDRDETERDFTVLKSNARRAKFWDKVKENRQKKIVFSMENFYFFLKLNGFYKINKTYVRKADYMYVKIDGGKIFRLIAPDKIKSEVKTFTKNWIENRKMMSIIPLLDKINTSTQISEQNLEGLPLIELEFRNCGKGIEYMHFAGGTSLKITRDEIKTVKHRDVPNYILGDLLLNNRHISHVIPHGIRITPPAVEVNPAPEYRKLLDELAAAKNEDERNTAEKKMDELPDIDRYEVIVNDKDFYFVQFLMDVSRLHWRKELEKNEPLTENEKKEQNLALANHLFALGYLSSEYKDKGRPWMVVTMDNKVSEVGQASGRSGKSLIAHALRYVRPVFTKGGRDLDNADNFRFIYDGYTEFHNVIEIDDFAEFGLFDRFYTEITGAREINPKNYSGFTLDYERSGKMVISTNFELQNSDSSTFARILYSTVSDYYHEKTAKNDYLETRKPDLKFGRQLYDDFNAEEWNKFYNLIAYCIQLQMRFYKINAPLKNIHRRELRREMQKGVGKTDDFFRWANTFFVPKPANWTYEYSPDGEGFLNTFIGKKQAFEEFQKQLTNRQKNDYRITHFKKHVEAWCAYHGYIFNPEELITDTKNRRIIMCANGKSEEFFFIASPADKGKTVGKTGNGDDYTVSNKELPF
ncbi:MAG: hypothetical protein LBH60_01060 [Prevotellaceae bacterium]|jgi:hypothetical protein|nr:hypothetical protein [Prevotellaceae bacterium]